MLSRCENGPQFVSLSADDMRIDCRPCFSCKAKPDSDERHSNAVYFEIDGKLVFMGYVWSCRDCKLMKKDDE